MRVTVKIPATTANLGSGFDCLGLALPIYNEITIEETVLPGSGVQIDIFNEIDDSETLYVPTDENSIVYKAIELLYNSVGQNPSELKITIRAKIPIAKGLGSSASVIVGGLIAANEILGNPADEAAILSIATEVEGHPDNIAPAVLGGVILSSQEDDGSVIYRRLNWPKKWNIMVCIPDYELATDISRSVLPKQVDMKDAIFNLKRSAMFIEAIHTEDTELMKLALQDKLHQPYRTKLVPGMNEIINSLKHEDNVVGSVLSGAGPAMVVIYEGNNSDNIKQIVKQTWNNLNVSSDLRVLEIEQNGAQIISD